MTARNPSSQTSPGERPSLAPASTLALARRLWGAYLSRYAGKLALAAAGMIAYALTAAAIPAGVEWINASLSGGSPTLAGAPASLRDLAWIGPAVILALGLANAGAQYFQGRLSASAALSALRDMQADMFGKLLVIDDAQLRSFGAGQSISRLTNDAAVLRETLTRVLSGARDCMTLVALCGVMIWYDWVLFATVLGIYAVMGWPVTRIGARLRKGSREAQAQTGAVAALVGEAAAGGRMIRAYGLEAREAARARAALDERLAVLQRMARLKAASEPFIFAVGAAAIGVVVSVVALRIEAGALNVSQFVSFIIALLMLSQPARGLSTLNAVTQEGFAAFERMLELIDLEPTIVDRPDAADLVVRRGEIRFRDVVFAYDDKGPALDGFSLAIPAGATAALVGESGAGKSTLFNLLLRLYEPQGGSILVDGVDIAGATLRSLRRSIAVVSQETTLFDDTVAANIGFGRAGASREEIVAAARAAAADGFIAELPGGFDARVGEGGLKLSGGQRQRIAIARAFLKDAPILLLDEATAALDAETEAQVQGALERLSKGRTTLVIAHRLATVRRADLIAVVDKGRVVETGAHDALMARGGAYARLAALQFELA